MFFIRGGFACFLLLASSAFAEPRIDPQELIELSLIGSPVSTDELGHMRGREGFDFQFNANFNDQVAGVTGNQISVDRTGGNLISDQAFSDASGNVTVIQNSGNGVAILSSTLINVSITY